MTLAILSTGDELVHGDTLNTNAQALAHILCSEGIPLGTQLTCSDKEEDIVDGLQFLSEKHSIIIITGGLGPTSDDRTRFALAQFIKEPLMEYEDAVNHITTLYKKLNREMKKNNLQQALFPPSTTLLPNPFGTALGGMIYWHKTQFILLPGPPRECLPMFENYVLPQLIEHGRTEKIILKWKLFGLSESEIASKLEDALADIPCSTGYRLDSPYIEFKIRCRPELAEEINARIEPIVQPHIICTPELKASERLRLLIESKGIEVEILDEVSGGLIQQLIQKPGSSHLISFLPRESAEVSFHLKGLKEYWEANKNTNLTSLTLEYKIGQLEHSQTQSINFHNALVLNYAAEWLCHRMAQVVEQRVV